MSESNNNIPMRITQLEEASSYPEGSYIPIAKAGWGTKKINAKIPSPIVNDLTEKTDISVHNGFVNTSGGISVDNDSRYSDAIHLKKGQTIYLYAAGYFALIAMISKINSANSRTMLVQSIDSNAHMYSYTATEDMDVCLSYHITSGVDVNVNISNNINKIEKKTEDNKKIIDELTKVDNVSWSDGYINTSGGKSSGGDCLTSNTISLYKGQKIVVYCEGYSTAISVISKYNGGTSYTMLVRSIDSTPRYYEYIATEDMDVVISQHINDNIEVSIYIVVKLYEKEVIIPQYITPIWNAGKYLTKNGQKGNEAKCHYSDPIFLKKGQYIVYKGMGYLNLIAMISITSENAAAYRSVVMSSNTTGQEKIYKYQAIEDCYVALSGYHTKDDSSSVDEIVYKYDAELPEEPYHDYTHLRHVFKNVLCIGDSLTEGDQGGNFNPRLTPWNYPYFMNKNTGWTTLNRGRSGFTVTHWWDTYKDEDFSSYDMAVIFLGTNLGLTDTLSTDVDPYDDYHDYADTNTGNYCKIIEKLLEENPKMSLFLVTPWNFERNYWLTTCEVLHKIGTRYNLPVFETVDKTVVANIFDTRFHEVFLDAHLNSIGYMILSDYLENCILKEINNHPLEYNPTYPNYGKTTS